MNKNIYYKVLTIFITIFISINYGYFLEVKYRNCSIFDCSINNILFSSIFSMLGPLILFLIGGSIEFFIVACFFIYFLLLIINWIIFFKPKLIHLFFALSWVTIGFIILHEFVG